MTTELNPFPSKTPPATGSEAVDNEHGIQLGLLDAARKSLQDDPATAAGFLEQLYTYTAAHFMSEQLLMRQAAQPNFDGHQQEHEVLLQQLDELCSLAASGDSESALKRIEQHEERLLAHIRTWDRSFGEKPQ